LRFGFSVDTGGGSGLAGRAVLVFRLTSGAGFGEGARREGVIGADAPALRVRLRFGAFGVIRCEEGRGDDAAFFGVATLKDRGRGACFRVLGDSC